MNTELTVKDVRNAICEEDRTFLGSNNQKTKTMSDEELLKANLSDDLGLDSLDVISVSMTLERKCNIVLPDASFTTIKKNGNTVQNLLNEFNRFLLA